MRTPLILAMCVAVIGCSRESGTRVRPSDRSWTNGTISVVPTETRGELGVEVHGQWPDGPDDLWIRYELHLVQGSVPDEFLCSSSTKLEAFQTIGTGTSDYSRADGFARMFDRNKPYRAVFDYEIWKGEPTKGELLAKNSVSSSDIVPRPSQ